MAPIRAAVAGATGYLGMTCTALLAGHPDVVLVRLLSRSHAGRRHSDVVPGSAVDMVLSDGLDPGEVEVVLAALPHAVAAAQAGSWLAGGAVVVDMSADFRLRDVDLYERWYGLQHPACDLAASAVYALPELHAAAVRGADLLAVPGCYPTAALLATVPALKAGLVAPDVIVDAKSGVSGAGRSPSAGTHFSEVNESVHAYGVAGHRHSAEMVQEMSLAAGGAVRVTFVPHLIPMTRGLLATAYLRPLPGVGHEQLRAVYAAFCEGLPCLRLDENPPPTKSVSGTNLAALHVGWQDGVAVVTCAVDNLVKGGAGQAVQAMNLRFGLEETAGLPTRSRWP
ncbi:MAG TPA: N-acetyl-gamma-glutamyl-phosphate reductase [Candidatus Dormibacteraeota bacterium]